MNKFIADTDSRFTGRTRVVLRAILRRMTAGQRAAPLRPKRILIAHHLLLGDTLMLTPLLAKLRQQYRDAEIVMAAADAYAPLYAGAPYGVRAIGWNPRAPSASLLWREKPFDVAYVPGDNRFSWLAQALGSRWIVAFGGERAPRKNLPVDELRPYPDQPAAWADIVATLVDGPAPAPFTTAAWRGPSADAMSDAVGIALAPAPLRASGAADFVAPTGRYALLHVGASTPLKRWSPERWRALAAWLAERGIAPVWSAGSREDFLVRECDPAQLYLSSAGQLSLAQLFHLAAGAALIVAPDTGVAHLGRIVGTPTVALFGPGSATLCGAGDFWRNAPYRAVTVAPFPCRDQRVLFKREIEWVQRCGRSTLECAHPRCMDAIDIAQVREAIEQLGVAPGGGPG